MCSAHSRRIGREVTVVNKGLLEGALYPRTRGAGAVMLALILGACSNTSFSSELPRGAAAYQAAEAARQQLPVEYRVGAYDLLEIKVFNEPQLSFREVPVDAEGAFSFPFLGRIAAQGLTPYELENMIKTRLDERYTRDAQVTVLVKAAASQVFSVEGDVAKPGQFQYAGNSTLLSALAQAGSPTETARLDEVAIFRFVDGQRYGAIFDLGAIRGGEVPDPVIAPGDTVVVGYSAIKEGWANFLSIGPILNAFTRF